MIARLNGRLLEKSPPLIVIDCNGVGYEVEVPMSTFYNLPELGQPVQVLTHMVVREDAQLLYGFGSEQEKNTFKQLLKVNGVGAKSALSILSGVSVSDLMLAVSQQEVSMLTRIPGIGKKTAERLLLELKGKLGADLITTGSASHDHASDILQALVALGYSDKEAALALKSLPPDVGVSDGIKMALKALAK